METPTKKFIADVSKDADLTMMFSVADKALKEIGEKHKAIMNEANEKSRELWLNVCDYLKAKGLIPQEYDPAKSELYYDQESGCIFHMSGEGVAFNELIRTIINNIGQDKKA